MKRAVLPALLGVAIGFSSAFGTARAESPPSMWDRARDQNASYTYRIHLQVQQRLAQEGNVSDRDALAVLAMLEDAKAEVSPDVRLRFDLGRVYEILGRIDARYYVRSANVLKLALRDAPDHPMAERAWLTLAFACGHAGERVCERDAYLEVLKRTTEQVLCATPMHNLAEAEMHLGNLAESIDILRELLRITQQAPVSRESVPLAVWNLAVALDRSGDFLAAEEQARFAVELERSMGMNPSPDHISALLHMHDLVFFVPAYEIYWYEGIGAVALAKSTKNPAESARLWRIAEQAFAMYLERSAGREASEQSDKWAEIARARFSAITAERMQAERRARTQTAQSGKKKPSLRAPRDTDDSITP
ncbi:MAG: tetratricopeptide repeat protein [Polyangiaceae bacterium]|nr:tetratricopeptide repeat protein [Polyangiaceae bacterium]